MSEVKSYSEVSQLVENLFCEVDLDYLQTYLSDWFKEYIKSEAYAKYADCHKEESVSSFFHLSVFLQDLQRLHIINKAKAKQ